MPGALSGRPWPSSAPSMTAGKVGRGTPQGWGGGPPQNLPPLPFPHADRVLVGAPLQHGAVNKMGTIYLCRHRSGKCQEVPACGPTVPQTCGENVHLNGFCILLDTNLQQLRRLPAVQQECPKSSSDVLFLIDGSGSIEHQDFLTMKTFIAEVMKRFKGTDTQFALAQFSDIVLNHFDFNTFRRSRNPIALLNQVQQIRRSTRTATAIWKVLTEMFVSRRGAREDVNKILIVITDGRKYDDKLEYSQVIPLAIKMGVTRYAIGVGSAFVDPAAEEELRTIASKPSEDHVFQVDNFDALQGIQNQLQEKIFAIEGTQSAHSSSFQLEMAQEGFSALLTPEGPVLGAVGAYGWSGGVFVYNDRNGGTTFVNVSRDAGDMNDAYLGYAAESLSLSGTRALALGAPRYRHVGRLLLFLLRGPQDGWQLAADATGPQVGSYFGASLCALDLNGDRSADLVLVGAPMFYGAGSGGRVAVCTLRPKGGRLPCQQTLQGQPGHPLGRFGASLARLGDIDGDRWPEVAVGAPLEDEERGAVYIFRGQRGGISSQYSQRISGARFSSGPRYFGQAISSGRDLTGDRLPDMAVGAQGQVLLLRYALGTHLPPATAWRMPWPLPTPLRLSPPGPKVRGLRRRLHGGCRERPRRGGLGVAQPAAPAWGTRSSLCAGQECPQDTLTPLLLRLTYDATGNPIQVAGGLRPALSEDSEMVAVGTVSPQLPFAKDCGTDNICIDDLQMSFNFSGLETIVVGMTSAVDVTVTLHNRGEDSYGTTIQLQHAEALSYRKAVVLQVPRPPPPPPKSFRASKTPRSRKDHPEVHTLPPRSPPDIFTSTQRPFWPPALLQTSPDHPSQVVLPTPVPTPDAPGPFSVLQEVHVRALQLGAGGGSVAQDPLPRQPPHLPLWHQGRGLPSVPVSPKPPRALGDVAVRWAGG
uniref:VWFA domain-containing protein n=1 Tax=Otus sunia TaxID=257818 RepID=A0A8C8E944_9STRI